MDNMNNLLVVGPIDNIGTYATCFKQDNGEISITVGNTTYANIEVMLDDVAGRGEHKESMYGLIAALAEEKMY